MLSTLLGLLLRTTVGPALQSQVNKTEEKEKKNSEKKKNERSCST